MTQGIKYSPETIAAMEETACAAKQLEKDIFAVACWLNMKFPEVLLSLEVQRHYSCEDCELAHVEPHVKEQLDVTS